MAKYDWERIEADFRTGRYTTRELSAMHGPEHSVIAKKAKRLGWQSDLDPLIKRLTKEKLLQSAVAEAATEGHAVATTAADAVAEVRRSVVEDHRAGLRRLRRIADQLSSELEAANSALQAVSSDDLMAMAGAAGLDPSEVKALLSMARTAERAVVVDRLAAVHAKIVPLERKVHGMDDSESEEVDWDALYQRAAAAARDALA